MYQVTKEKKEIKKYSLVNNYMVFLWEVLKKSLLLRILISKILL